MYQDRKQKSPVRGFHAAIATVLLFLPVLLNAQQTGTPVQETTEPQTGIAEIRTPISTEFATYTPYRVPAFRPEVGTLESTLHSDFSNVIVPRNGFAWDRFFTASDRAALLRNQAALRPENMGSFAQAYAGMNDMPEFVPFITTDAVLSGLRASADEAYREAQRDRLAPDLRTLLATLSRVLNSSADNESNSGIKIEILRVLAWTETARLLLDPSAVPQASVANIVYDELDKVQAGQPDKSVIFSNRRIDYGMFAPVGHYRVNQELERYYQAKTWLSHVGLRVRSDGGSLNSSEARMAFILARTLDGIDEREQRNLNDIVTIERFFAGEKSAALTPQMAAGAMRAYYGFQYGIGFSYLADDGSLNRLVDYMERSLPKGYGEESVMRLLPVEGQLSDLLFATMRQSARLSQGEYGRTLAAALQKEVAGESKAVKQMRATLARLPIEEWVKDAQWTTLYTAQALAGVDAVSDGHPRFMNSDLWKERRMQGALGAWTAFSNERGILPVRSLKPQTVGVQTAPDNRNRAALAGYVEPDPVAWSVVASQARYLREGLAERMRGSLIDSDLEAKLQDIENVAAQFARIAAAELRGISFTEEQSALIASAPERIAAWETFIDRSLQGDNMMLVASAQTKAGSSGPATGHPVALYVIAPNPVEPSELVLLRGAVYSYHETTLSGDAWAQRATDESQETAGLYVVPATDIEVVEAKLRNVTTSVAGSQRRDLLGGVHVEIESSVVRRSSGALWYTVHAPGYDGADVITSVVDVSGRQVFQSFPLPIENGERFDMVPVDELKSGQYFIRVSDVTGRNLASGRFLVVR